MNDIKNKLKTVLKHELITGSFYIFIGTTFSSFLAFLLNVYFARELTYAQYGILASLSSLIALLIIPSSSLSAVIVKYATVFYAKNETGKASEFYKKSIISLLLFSVIINIFTLLIFPLISDFLKIEDILLILLTTLSVSAFYFATLNKSFIQSLLRFKLLGFIYIVSGIGKLTSGVVLVMLGFNIYGAILSILIFSFIDYFITLIFIKNNINKKREPIEIGIKPFVYYAGPTALSLFALSSFIATDVLLVKHFFSSVEAGLYGGLSLVGKVIFYFTGPIALAMFPLIVKKHAMNEKYNGLFILSLILVTSASLLITLIYFIFPDFIISLFLGGNEYLKMSQYLGMFGIFLTIYSINFIFVNFFLSIKKIFVSFIVLFFAFIQVIFIYLHHNHIGQIINISILVSVLLMISLVLYYLKLIDVRNIYKTEK